MEAVKVGQLITEPQQRDAIHVAIAPVVAKFKLFPGQDVGIDGTAVNPIGIVDPFLTKPVNPEQTFWLFLYPNTITSLRHDWTHPAFSEQAPAMHDKAFAEKWLRIYAAKLNRYDDADKAFASLIDGLKSGDLTAHGSNLYGEHDIKQADELKRQAEIYLGIQINWDDFSFSCSC